MDLEYDNMGSCYRSQKRFCSKKGKDISIFKNRKEKSTRVFKRLVEKEIYLTIKVTTNITSVLCAEEEWKEENSARL